MKKLFINVVALALLSSCSGKPKIACYEFLEEEVKGEKYTVTYDSKMYREDQPEPFEIVTYNYNINKVNPNVTFKMESCTKLGKKKIITDELLEKEISDDTVNQFFYSEDKKKCIAVLEEKKNSKGYNLQDIYLFDFDMGIKTFIGTCRPGEFVFVPESECFSSALWDSDYKYHLFFVMLQNEPEFYYENLVDPKDVSKNLYHTASFFYTRTDLIDNEDIYYDGDEMGYCTEIKVRLPNNTYEKPKIVQRVFPNYARFEIIGGKRMRKFENGIKVVGLTAEERIEEYFSDNGINPECYILSPFGLYFAYLADEDNEI